ncbi:MAG: DMT family transporter [Anaerolineae bacterium]|nr:DMT family transporter [Anaerolineae bacterium]
MGKRPQTNGLIYILLAATLWGTTGTSQALAPAEATPPVIGLLRLGVGGVILLCIALVSGVFFTRKVRIPIKSTLLAAICIAAYQVLFFGGVARTGVAIGTIVGIGSCPIMGGILGYFFRGERPGWKWVIATLLAVCGAGLLAWGGADVHVDLWGLLLATGAGAAYAAFTLFSKELFEVLDPKSGMAIVFCLGTCLLVPVLIFNGLKINDLAWVLQPRGALVVAHLGIITVGLAYSLFGMGLLSVAVSTTTTLTLAEPLTAGILGVTLLGERLTPVAAAGIILIFSGIAVLSIRFPEKKEVVQGQM